MNLDLITWSFVAIITLGIAISSAALGYWPITFLMFIPGFFALMTADSLLIEHRCKRIRRH